MSAPQLSDYCWQQELIALLMQWPCGHWTFMSHSYCLSVSDFLVSVHLDLLKGISLSMNWVHKGYSCLIVQLLNKKNRITVHFLKNYFGAWICTIAVDFVFYILLIIFLNVLILFLRVLFRLLLSFPTNQWRAWKEVGLSSYIPAFMLADTCLLVLKNPPWMNWSWVDWTPSGNNVTLNSSKLVVLIPSFVVCCGFL